MGEPLLSQSGLNLAYQTVVNSLNIMSRQQRQQNSIKTNTRQIRAIMFNTHPTHKVDKTIVPIRKLATVGAEPGR